MKYIRLEQDELTELEKEFIDFLVVNGITADDWVAIKEKEPENAEEIIDQFSDVVWEGVLRGVQYLKKIESNTAYYFKTDEKEIHLIRVVKVNDTAEQHIASKRYAKVRELELFEMIQNGCTINDGEEYKTLE
jgi:hypothetical protein